MELTIEQRERLEKLIKGIRSSAKKVPFEFEGGKVIDYKKYTESLIAGINSFPVGSIYWNNQCKLLVKVSKLDE